MNDKVEYEAFIKELKLLPKDKQEETKPSLGIEYVKAWQTIYVSTNIFNQGQSGIEAVEFLTPCLDKRFDCLRQRYW